ncbi:TPA: hypothetical protein EYO12_03465 [Candidatus Saccharibacteria bacterium]|nr:hypothetical protein [Candidatus Saccharibacteria bacterium]HIO87910.1 hypothetical protein [Candidatus Saccharibacteria bacterium]
MSIFVRKKQPNPLRNPRKFFLSVTPLFLAFYIFFKATLSVLLGVLVYNLGVDSVNGSDSLVRLTFYWFGLLVTAIDFYAWVVLPTREWLKKNKKADLFIILNLALAFIIAFVAIFAITQSDSSSCKHYIDSYDSALPLCAE